MVQDNLGERMVEGNAVHQPSEVRYQSRSTALEALEVMRAAMVGGGVGGEGAGRARRERDYQTTTFRSLIHHPNTRCHLLGQGLVT
jgi:hypothetical protein